MKKLFFIVICIWTIILTSCSSQYTYHCLEVIGVEKYQSSEDTEFCVSFKSANGGRFNLYTDDEYRVGQTIGNCK